MGDRPLPPRRRLRLLTLGARCSSQAELAISEAHQAESLSLQRPLLVLLFRLMAERSTVDAALTLAQELLAVGPDIFPLSCVAALPRLLEGLSPSGLSLVGRALAVLLAKAAEQTMDGVPAPECVAPDLCASCANNQLLLSVPCFTIGLSRYASQRKGPRRSIRSFTKLLWCEIIKSSKD